MSAFTEQQFEAIERVLAEVLGERVRQHARWGEQNHPDGTGTDPEGDAELRDTARESCERAFAEGRGTYRHILDEEVLEAFAERDPAKLRLLSCSRCGHRHRVRESNLPGLQAVRCDDGTVFLVGVNGKRVGTEP